MPGVSLSLLVLKTRQVESLRTFYATLGIELTEEQHGQGPVHYAGRIAGVVLEIYPLLDGAMMDTSTRLGFTVEKMMEALEALQALGTVVVTQPQATDWGYRAVVRDPDGRSVELYQELFRAGDQEGRLYRLSPKQLALYHQIRKLREEIGPIDLDIVTIIRELRDDGRHDGH